MGSSGLFSAGCMQWLPLGIFISGPRFFMMMTLFYAMFSLFPGLLLLFAGLYLKSEGNRPVRRVISVSAIVMGKVLSLLFVLLLVLSLPAFLRGNESARRASCMNNLKQWGLVYKMFSGESKGMYYPELSPEAGRLMFALGENRGSTGVYPEYLTDPTILFCPKDPAFKKIEGEEWKTLEVEKPAELLNDRWYLYLGYVLRSDEEVLAFAKAYRERVAAGKRFDEDLKVPPSEGNCDTDTLYQLREGIDDSTVNLPSCKAAKSEIPVMIERVENNHEPKGGHVLYMDGHVEFVPYPGKWPMTETTITTLEELANMDGKPPVVQKSEAVSSKLRFWAVVLAFCIIVGIAIGLCWKWGLPHAKARSRKGEK